MTFTMDRFAKYQTRIFLVISPQHRGGDAADEGMTKGYARPGQDHIKGGEQKNHPHHTDEVKADFTQTAESGRRAREGSRDGACIVQVQCAAEKSDKKKTESHQHDVHIGENGGNNGMPPFYSNAMVKDEVNRIFQHCESSRAEKKHKKNTDPTHCLPVLKKGGGMVEKCVRQSGNQQLELAVKNAQQLLLFNRRGERATRISVKKGIMESSV